MQLACVVPRRLFQLSNVAIELGMPPRDESSKFPTCNFADVACSTGVFDRGCEEISQLCSVRRRGAVFRHYYKSIAKSAGNDFRHGAAVPG